MPPFHFRLTCDVADNAKYCDFLLRNSSGKFLCVAEKGNRDHIHCYLEFQMTKKSFMNKFNEKFKGLDRRDKYLDEDKGTTLQYICKGPNSKVKTDVNVVAKRTLTELDIVQLHDEFWKNRVIDLVPIVLTPSLAPIGEYVELKKKSKRAKPWLQEYVYDELLAERDDWGYGIVDKQKIFKQIMLRGGQMIKIMDNALINRWIIGIQNALAISCNAIGSQAVQKGWQDRWSLIYPNEPSLDACDTELDFSLV